MDRPPRALHLTLLVRAVRPADRVRAVERAGEGRVEVDDRAVLEPLQERRAEHVHPAGQHDEVRRSLQDQLGQVRVVLLPLPPRRRVRLERAGCGGNARLRGPLEAAGALAVRHHQRDAARQLPAAARVDERLQVRAVAGYQDDKL
ncbi:MAG: hypothetical protein BJ554DRAFT_871 [Olpidium bornovanus]|uniref:Uncharacterized protein n=1 Tax=Olpidium bornovanus TaxID=278681 RepID=A0A8H7ZT48_9FUNG|nr:MAG: hypothetical protein BJ554DRAFT_871 [Olpidium bornovanus]